MSIAIKKIPIVASILSELKDNLSEHLCYHSYDHTIDVIDEVILFAEKDGLSSRETELLVIAAAYHDAGFLQEHAENEALGGARAWQAMIDSKNYSPEEAALVKTMILDTKMRITEKGFKQIPTTKLSAYLLDADVSNLGREDFFEKGKLVLKELGLNSEKQFLKHSLDLIIAHQWHTPAARSLRQEQKEKNIEKLKELVK